MAQPALSNSNGVIVGVGIRVGNDRTEILVPMAGDGFTLTPDQLARAAVDAMENNGLPVLLPCLSSDAEVSYISGEPMQNGNVPFRKDYPAGTNPGTRAAGAAPSNVAALLSFYGDPTQTPPGGRTRIGKNFLAGIAKGDLVGDLLVGALQAVLQTLADALFGGIASTIPGGGQWYRVVKALRGATQALQNIVIDEARDYVTTQRRRLLPR